MVIIFQSCPRNLLQHGTDLMKPEEPWGTLRNPNAQTNRHLENKKEKLPLRPCVFVRSVSHMRNSLPLQTLWMCVKRRCRDSSEMRSFPGVDTHTLSSSVGRWWRHEVNIISAESATGGSHERSLIFSRWRDTWFVLFSRKADNAPMKISGGFHHDYCSPHTIFKCILDYVAM